MFVCLIYVGNVIMIVKFVDVKKVVMVCGIVFDVVGIGGLVVVEIVDVLVGLFKLVFVFEEIVVSDCLEFIVVKCIVFGGCVFGFVEEFECLMNLLVDKLGVVVGVLCVVVDVGYVLNDY